PRDLPSFPTRRSSDLDHAGGAREYVAHGAVVVAAENARELLAEIFAAPSTVVPDSLEAAPLAPVFQTVPLFGSVVLGDATHPVRSEEHTSELQSRENL